MKPNKNVIFSCSHCSNTIFVLISYSLNAQIMLILILIYIQYSQKVVFSFENGLNCQNHSSSGSHYPVIKSFRSPPHPLLLFGKPCLVGFEPGTFHFYYALTHSVTFPKAIIPQTTPLRCHSPQLDCNFV